MTPRFSYVLPVHNQVLTLRASVVELAAHLRGFPGSEVILVENGSSDGSARLCAALAAELAAPEVPIRVAQSAVGLGNALRRGMELATGDVVVLTAADLPFGFSDLDAYLAAQPRPSIAIGSKAHPGSRTSIALQRRVMSEGFRLMRRAVLGLRVADSQGTILIASALAREVLPRLRCGDFLISTEVVCWAIRLGATPVELPVTYTAGGRSTVSPVRDSLRMARGLVSLRHRLRESAAPAARS